MSLQVDLSNKVALVTGAGRGMGRAFALAFAGQGARVVINDIEAAGLGGVADTIRNKGGKVLACPGDITRKDQVDDMIINVASNVGKVARMNNAAYCASKGDLDSFRAGIPMGRLAKPEEQADMVLFLSSEHANHITGQTFFVDGGQTMV